MVTPRPSVPVPAHLGEGAKALLAVGALERLVFLVVGGLVLREFLGGWESAIAHVAGKKRVTLPGNRTRVRGELWSWDTHV